MAFPIGAGLLDAIVLAVVEQESTYGYKITQEIRGVIELSESTLYPVLRRLLKEGCLCTFDKEFNGRNRRYYQLTPFGKVRLAQYRGEWREYCEKVSSVLLKEEEAK